uniref:Uncharacterized protein n=1 Tax=Oryza glaberrima TaxID=4538 RepID=I1QZ32_ORYGL
FIFIFMFRRKEHHLRSHPHEAFPPPPTRFSLQPSGTRREPPQLLGPHQLDLAATKLVVAKSGGPKDQGKDEVQWWQGWG